MKCRDWPGCWEGFDGSLGSSKEGPNRDGVEREGEYRRGGWRERMSAMSSCTERFTQPGVAAAC